MNNAFETGMRLGMEKVAASRALKELRKLAPESFPKGQLAHPKWFPKNFGVKKKKDLERAKRLMEIEYPKALRSPSSDDLPIRKKPRFGWVD